MPSLITRSAAASGVWACAQTREGAGVVMISAAPHREGERIFAPIVVGGDNELDACWGAAQ